MIQLPSKAPGDVVDYPVEWSALLATGEVIVSVSSVVETGLTEEALSDNGASLTTQILSGGTEGETYQITLTITTDQGTPARQFQRFFCLTVEAK